MNLKTRRLIGAVSVTAVLAMGTTAGLATGAYAAPRPAPKVHVKQAGFIEHCAERLGLPPDIAKEAAKELGRGVLLHVVVDKLLEEDLASGYLSAVEAVYPVFDVYLNCVVPYVHPAPWSLAGGEIVLPGFTISPPATTPAKPATNPASPSTTTPTTTPTSPPTTGSPTFVCVTGPGGSCAS